jgi:N-methylhydantoinase A
MQEASEQGSRAARIAVDIGGTFTDLVLVEGDRAVATAKVLTTPEDPSRAVEQGIARLLEHVAAEDVRQVVHATTLATNALIERKGAATALITTKGFRDVITIRRELRYDLYDLFLELPDPLVPRRNRYELNERVLADGSIDVPIDADEVDGIIHELKREGIEAAAISLLHSYRNAEHERFVAEALERELPDLHFSISSEVSPELDEFARTSTVIANAYVLPLISRYLDMLETRLRDLGMTAPLLIMLSTGGGGLVGAEVARRFPVRLLESGPAAGVLSARFWGEQAAQNNVLAFDMGGTTAKACLMHAGQPMVAKEFEAARVYRFTKGSGLPLRIPVIDLIEIGAGGGSIARVGALGTPKVGPESAGADPGPACYAQGGTEPTVTDADLILGYLNPEFFLGGEMTLDPTLSRKALDPLAVEIGLTVEDAAAAIHQLVNENMASAARMHAVERGQDIGRFSLVATGGAGPVHAWGVARGLGVRTLIFPPSAGVASAFGMLTAAPGFEFGRSLPSVLSDVEWNEVRAAIASMVEQGVDQLASVGIDRDRSRVAIAADVRHRGQGETVTVELGNELSADPVRQVESAFEDVYVSLYGRRPPGVEAEVMTWRVRVTGPEPEIEVRVRDVVGGDAQKAERPMWFSETDGFVDTPVYDRYALRPGNRMTGPLVVEERESTTLVGPGGQVSVDEFGSLVVELP